MTLLERDISHSASERIIFKDAAHIACFVLNRISTVIKDLNINIDISNHNVEIFNQMTDSQEDMNKKIKKGFSRKEAHNFSQELVESKDF